MSAFFNLADRGQPLPGGVPAGQELLFSSEAGRYRGGREGVGNVNELLAHECLAFGPRGWERFI